MDAFQGFFSVAFLLALFAGLRKFDKAEAERKSLAAKCAELDAQIKKNRADDAETLNRVREYYYEQIKRHEGHVDTLKKMIHMERKFTDMDTKFIDLLFAKLDQYEKEKKG